MPHQNSFLPKCPIQRAALPTGKPDKQEVSLRILQNKAERTKPRRRPADVPARPKPPRPPAKLPGNAPKRICRLMKKRIVPSTSPARANRSYPPKRPPSSVPIPLRTSRKKKKSPGPAPAWPRYVPGPDQAHPEQAPFFRASFRPAKRPKHGASAGSKPFPACRPGRWLFGRSTVATPKPM